MPRDVVLYCAPLEPRQGRGATPRLRWAAARILVTGAAGFTGRHLVARLQSRSGVPALPAEVEPEVAFHLAWEHADGGPRPARSSAGTEESANIAAFERLCGTLRRQAGARPVRLITIGSAAEIGPVEAADLPVREDVPCRPSTSYGKAKWEITRRALEEPRGGPLEIVVARAFNLVGPGLSARMALGSFARQIAAVRRGEADAVRCGNLDARRDFVDVRDAVDAYIALAERGRPGEVYNVCSGRSYRIGDLLEQMIALAGGGIAVAVETDLRRAGDVADIYGDPATIHRDTGWAARTPIAQSLADLLAAEHADAVGAT